MGRYSLFDLSLYTFVRSNLGAGMVGIELHLCLREIGHIEGIDTLLVILLRLPLWQHEGFGESTLFIDACQIETAIQSVIPTTGKDNPVRIQIPVMVAVCLIAVDLLQDRKSTRLNSSH